MNTAANRRGHPVQLKQLGRHRSYATLAANIEEGDLFEDNALNGVLQGAPSRPLAGISVRFRRRCDARRDPSPAPGFRTRPASAWTP
jgi:hypothetical protein